MIERRREINRRSSLAVARRESTENCKKHYKINKMSSTQSIIRNFDDLVRCSSVLSEGIETGKEINLLSVAAFKSCRYVVFRIKEL